MNTDVLQGNLKELKGELKQTWSKLTDDDINYIDGGVDQFIGKVQKTYGFTKERAIEEFDRFRNKNPRFFGHDTSRSMFSNGARDASSEIKQHANQYMDQVKHVGSNVAQRASTMVQERPGYTLLGAAAIGFLCGSLLFRRSSTRY